MKNTYAQQCWPVHFHKIINSKIIATCINFGTEFAHKCLMHLLEQKTFYLLIGSDRHTCVLSILRGIWRDWKHSGTFFPTTKWDSARSATTSLQQIFIYAYVWIYLCKFDDHKVWYGSHCIVLCQSCLSASEDWQCSLLSLCNTRLWCWLLLLSAIWLESG